MDFRGQTAQPYGAGGVASSYAAAEDVFGDAMRDADWSRRHHGLPQSDRASPKLDVIRRNPQSLRVLIVDDTFTNRRLAELILKHQGHQVVTVSNGGEAVRLARNPVWDVILMDLQMPVMNGWQATQAIRRHERAIGQNPPVPIIAFTAYAIPGNHERCLQAGMDDFLAKPVDAQLLVERVERLARNGHPEHE